jgi:hypothetical protein
MTRLCFGTDCDDDHCRCYDDDKPIQRSHQIGTLSGTQNENPVKERRENME